MEDWKGEGRKNGRLERRRQEEWKIGRMEGGTVLRLNRDFCDSRIFRIIDASWLRMSLV